MTELDPPNTHASGRNWRPAEGPYGEDAKEIGGDRSRRNALGSIRVVDDATPSVECRERLECVAFRLPILEVGCRRGAVRDLDCAVLRFDPDESLGLRERQRPKQHTVDETEDLRVHPGAKRERHDRDRDE